LTCFSISLSFLTSLLVTSENIIITIMKIKLFAVHCSLSSEDADVMISSRLVLSPGTLNLRLSEISIILLFNGRLIAGLKFSRLIDSTSDISLIL